MVNKVYSAVLNINFDDFEDEEEFATEEEESLSVAASAKILKTIYLNLLMTLGPKVKSVFTNLELVNEDKFHVFYNEVISKMDMEIEAKRTENLIYDFFTVAKGEFTEINIGFSAKSVYVATVSSKKCIEQEVISNYIEKNFLSNFLNETAKDTLRYKDNNNIDAEDIKKMFMYATILSLGNAAYPISFSPLYRYTKQGDDVEQVHNKIRRIYRTLIETYGE